MLSVFAITALYTELRKLKQEMLLTFIFFFRVCAILILKPNKASVLSSYSYPNAARECQVPAKSWLEQIFWAWSHQSLWNGSDICRTPLKTEEQLLWRHLIRHVAGRKDTPPPLHVPRRIFCHRNSKQTCCLCIMSLRS